ncbi:MAG: peptidylprolyl isomerase [Candidatus Aenigmarchaeota archaeon]|nr:peptidylprolyl isomerase [Candidatus Aenigmarchaeota archaeon]
MAGSKDSKNPKVAKKGEKSNDAQAVKKGDIIKVEYEGSLEDGTVFDCTANHNYMPIEFEAGVGKMIKGFDEAVMGMKKGEEKKIKLKPEQAYGPVHDVLIQKMPRAQLPKEAEPKPGMMLVATLPTGEQVPAKIVKVDKDTVTMDFNHPLAGKSLVFKIKVVGIKSK